MKKIILVSLIVILIVSCSKKEEKLPVVGPAYIIENLESFDYFGDTLIPTELKQHKLTLTEPVKTVRPKELHSLDSSWAEVWLTHLCVGLSYGEYSAEGINYTVEVMQFADETHAYGYYSSLRPLGVQTERIGTESFATENSRYMVKSDYVFLTFIDDLSDARSQVMRDICIEIDRTIIGSQATPPFFLLFPFASKIIPSNKYYPYQYLGIPGFNDVYTTSYLIGTDTLTLFLTLDQTAEKFKYVRQFANQKGDVVESFNRFKFDSTFSVAFKDNANGVVVAGVKSLKLIGVVGYNPKTADKIMVAWIKGL